MFNFSRENTSTIARWWRNIDKEILFLFIFLFLLGLFFSFSSTSSVVAEKMNKQTYFFFVKHLIFVSISLFLLVAISIQDKRKLINFLPYLFLISLLLLFLIPLFGVEVKGSKRWMDFPLLPRFQPVELLKPLFIVFVAKIIVLNEKTNIYRRYLYSFLVLLLIVILLINQPDLGQTLLFASAWVTMIFVSGFNMFFFVDTKFGIFRYYCTFNIFFPRKVWIYFFKNQNVY